MEIIGREYRRKLVPVSIEVKHYKKSFAKVNTPTLVKLWGRRKCFCCWKSFKNGDEITIVIPVNYKNIMLCKKCSDGQTWEERP